MQRSVVMVTLLVSALAQTVFFLGSAEAELLTAWVPDDAFYCLQPAWMFGKGQGFTFDGLQPTYGFQPLWTLLLGVLSAVLGTKSQLLTASLMLGALCHLATGGLLFRCLERWGHADSGVIAAAIWLCNPDLIRVQASGLESGLVGVLTLIIVLRAPTGEHSARDAGVLGLLCGLLFLSRVSLLPMAVVMGVWSGARSPRHAAWFVVGWTVVALPWLLWANHALGQPLPLSGDRKLIGGPAGLARFLATWPGVSLEFVRSWLSEREVLLLASDQFATPSWSRLWSLGPRATAGWALGHWVPGGLAGVGLFKAVALAGLAAAAAWGWRTERPAVPRPVLVLAAVATVHALAHHLLLNSYVEYGYWYRVPELMVTVLLAALLLAPARHVQGPGRPIALACLVVVGGLGLGDFFLASRPASFDASADRVSVGVLSVARSMDERLPPGTPVGAWNAGLLGWATERAVVINLDGLGNSVAFAPVAEAEVLFRHGHGARNPTLDWLDVHGVRTLADLHPIAGLGSTPFYDLIPPGRYRPVLRGPAVTHWGRPGRNHAVALVALVPAE